MPFAILSYKFGGCSRDPLRRQMSKEFNTHQMTQYLLGSLSGPEAEHLDELAVGDGDFATALRATENDLVDAYIQGELGNAELEQFESRYLASPLRRQKVEFAEAFQSWAEKKPVQETEAPPKTKKAGWFSAFSLTPPRPALQWGFAVAALIFLIAGVWLVIENSRLRQQITRSQGPVGNQVSPREQDLKRELDEQRAANSRTEQELAQLHTEHDRLETELEQRGVQQRPPSAAIASFLLTPQLRGAGQIMTIAIPNGTERVSMHLRLEPNEYSSYSAALVEAGTNRTAWRSGKIQARGSADSKYLTVNFAAGLLTKQNYMLRVSGIASMGSSEVLGDYPFRVVK